MEEKDLAAIIQRFQEKVYSLDFNSPLDYVETETERAYVELAARSSHYIILEDDGETPHITHAQEKYQRWHKLKAWKYQLGPDLISIAGKQVLVNTFYDGEQPGLRRAPQARISAPLFKTVVYRLTSGDQINTDGMPDAIYTAVSWKDALYNHHLATRDSQTFSEQELKLGQPHLQLWPSLVEQPGEGLSSSLSKWLEALSDKNRAYFLSQLQDWSNKAHEQFHQSLTEGMQLMIAEFVVENDLGETEWFEHASHRAEIDKILTGLKKHLSLGEGEVEEQ